MKKRKKKEKEVKIFSHIGEVTKIKNESNKRLLKVR